MSNKLGAIAAPLLAWYAQNKRELPWRQDREPYHVWVSEIMLQQTRIEAVMRYYARFMRELPDIKSLSEVSDDRLLKLWEGLGYYSRARNLKKAAQTVMNDFGGAFPRRYAEIVKLAGIGDYTAGAIASICFNEKVPAVDGNVLRVISRVTASRENVLLPETKKAVTQRLFDVMPEQAGDFNEALMELGEVVCLPNGEPNCAECPLSAHCAAFKENLIAELPVRIKRQKRRQEQKTVLRIVAPSGETALRKRGASGLLAGMYELPNAEGFLGEAEIRFLLADRGLKITDVSYIKEAKHVFTHVEWLMKGWRVAVIEKSGGFIWATAEDMKKSYALPTAFQKMLKQEN